MYPVMLDLKNKKVLVVGGGAVALRKVTGLLETGANITVVSKDMDVKLTKLAKEKRIIIKRKKYNNGDASDFHLVFAATDDQDLNRTVFEDGQKCGIWVNVADDPELCSFHLPARVKRGDFQIALASSGNAPFAVRKLRKILEKKFGPEWSGWMESAAKFRKKVYKLGIKDDEAARLFDLFFSKTVDEKDLTSKVLEKSEENKLFKQVITQPDKIIKSCESASALNNKSGFVSLVGAGPGDPGLMTLRGRQRILDADVIICDRLAIPALPCDLDDKVTIHFVGKKAGKHPVPQNEINRLIVKSAKEGKNVVRLKGGDPYVFGRGGEEALVLVEETIPFEVIPSVTSAVAASAYAGIPITFRNQVVRATLVTAHEAAKSNGPQVRWDLLAQDPHAMILGYMGVTSLPNVIKKLLDNGMDPDTCAALVERGTTPGQKTVISSLQNLHEDSIKKGIKPPALFAIGKSVIHAKKLGWFEKRPLFKERLVAISPAEKLVKTLWLSGAQIIGLNEKITNAALLVINAMPVTGCILQSESDAQLLVDLQWESTWEDTAVAWCLGEKIFESAKKLKWANPVLVKTGLNWNNLAKFISEKRNSS